MSFYRPQFILSQNSREKCLANLKKANYIKPGSVPVGKKAAVLIPLCVVDSNVSLLYTLRSSNLKNYSGHISFPGGKSDNDETPIETALRETEEELGISREQIDVWGEGPAVFGKGKQLVNMVVGEIKDFDINKLQPSVDEVEEVFTVPIQSLCDQANQAHTQFDGDYILPVFLYRGKVIWGLTAFMTHVLLSSLLPSEAYKNDFLSKKVVIKQNSSKL